MEQFVVIHWIVIFGVATIELKRVEIPAAAFESNISYVRIGQALELVEKRGKVILGTPLPIKNVFIFTGIIDGAIISAGLQATVKVN